MQRTYRLGLQGAINVPEAVRAAMRPFGTRRRFTDGQFIMTQGDVADGFFAVAHGQVMVGRHAEGGTLTIYGVAGAGDLFGEQAFFTATPRIADAVADGDVEVVHFDAAAFGKLIAHDPAFAMLIIRSLAEQLRIITNRVDAERHLSVADRLAEALLAMENSGGSFVACTHQQLADFLGVSRVTLGMAVRQLERAGAIAGGYGKVHILNRKLLESKLLAAGRGAVSNRILA